MFDGVSTLILHNIQSHTNTKLYFNRTGIHRISAESNSNSYGKSAMLKGAYALFLGEYLNKEGREALIRYGCDFGIVSATSFSGARLTLALHLESSKTFYQLEYGGKKVTKYLADDYKSLLKIANFHYFEEAKFSLNRYKTKTTLPFTHTSGTLNYKILDSASELPKFKELITAIEGNLEQIKYDKEGIKRVVTSLTEQIRIMETGNIPLLEQKLKAVKNLRDRYHELKPTILTLNTIIEKVKEKSSIVLNDYKLFAEAKPNLDSLTEMISILGKIEQNKIEATRLKEVSKFDYEKVQYELNNLKALSTLSNQAEKISNDLFELSLTRMEKVEDLSGDFLALNQVNSIMPILNSVSSSKFAIEELRHKLEFDREKTESDVVNLKQIREISKYVGLVHKDKIKIKEVSLPKVNDLTEELRLLKTLSKMNPIINLIEDGKNKIAGIDLKPVNNLDEELELLNRLNKLLPTLETISINKSRIKDNYLEPVINLDEEVELLNGLNKLLPTLETITTNKNAIKDSYLEPINNLDEELLFIKEISEGISWLDSIRTDKIKVGEISLEPVEHLSGDLSFLIDINKIIPTLSKISINKSKVTEVHLEPVLDFSEEIILIKELEKASTLLEVIERSKIDIKEIDSRPVPSLDEELEFIGTLSEIIPTLQLIESCKLKVFETNLEPLNKVKEELDSLQLLDSILPVLSTISLSKNSLKRVSVDRVNDIGNQLEFLEEVENMLPIISSILNDRNYLTKIQLEPVTNLDTELEFIQQITQLNSMLNNLISHTEQLNNQLEKSKELDKELSSLTEQIGVCTKCGRPFDENHHHTYVNPIEEGDIA